MIDKYKISSNHSSRVAIKAAIFGAGCWASRYDQQGLDGMACSISG